MAYEKGYEKTTWEDSPSTATPISGENLNRMEEGIGLMDGRTVELSQLMELSDEKMAELNQLIEKIREIVGDESISLNRIGDTGYGSIAYGGNCEASQTFAVVFGTSNRATAPYTFVHGASSQALGMGASAIGLSCIAKGQASHAAGMYLTASGESQAVFGKNNVEDTEGKYALIIGGGIYENKNVFTIDWDGNTRCTGDITNGDGVSLSDILEKIKDIETREMEEMTSEEMMTILI